LKQRAVRFALSLRPAPGLRRVLWLRLELLILILLLGAPLSAHDPFEITTSGKTETDRLVLEVTMTRASAWALATGTHAIRAGFAPEAFPALQPELQALASSLYDVLSCGRALPLQSALVQLSEEGEVQFLLTYERPLEGPLRLTAKHLGQLPEGYGNLVNLQQTAPAAVLGFKLLTFADPVFDAHVIDTNATAKAQLQSERTPLKYLLLGVEHILTGYDHLLFLAGLLVASRSARAMLAVITCFTLAHSLTLALGALDLVAVPSSIVEPLIAVSIVWVGVENLLRRDQAARHLPKRQLAVAFAFGLIHGLAFAGGLQSIGASTKDVVLVLLSFNAGIELVQIALSVALLPILLALRDTPRGPAGLRLTSIMLAGMGIYWLLSGDRSDPRALTF
jgi:hydrogenase/urease accessory protein HupE